MNQPGNFPQYQCQTPAESRPFGPGHDSYQPPVRVATEPFTPYGGSTPVLGQQQMEQEQYNPPIHTAAVYIPATEHQNAPPMSRRVGIFCRALNAVRASHFHETFRSFLTDKGLGVFERVRFRKAPRHRGSLIDFRIRVGYWLVYVDSNVAFF